MKSSTWVALLQMLPPEQYNKLMFVTTAGIEIALQTILRIDQEFVAIKGRLAGSQDAGRVFFLPFSRLEYLGFQYAVKETEFQEMFGNLVIDDAPAGEIPAGAVPPAGPALPGAPAAIVGPGRTPTPIKSAVLERFRSRTTAAGTTLRPAVEE